eukprot:4430105-Prymnesium_polylepis.1
MKAKLTCLSCWSCMLDRTGDRLVRPTHAPGLWARGRWHRGAGGGALHSRAVLHHLRGGTVQSEGAFPGGSPKPTVSKRCAEPAWSRHGGSGPAGCASGERR